MTNEQNTIIAFSDVTVKRDDFVALDSISFAITQGEYIGIIGPNGAGKTTLLLTILGLIQPSEGTIFISQKARIGYVPQQYLPNNNFPVSVREIISMGFYRGWFWPSKKEEEDIKQALEAVGMKTSFLSRNFSTLSGGQKQRVIIARSLVHNPNVLLFDEPTSGIDLATKIQIYALLSSLNKEKGITIAFVSHEIEHVVKSCDRILCLDKHLHEGCEPIKFAQSSLQEKPSQEEEIVPIRHTKQKQENHKEHALFERNKNEI